MLGKLTTPLFVFRKIMIQLRRCLGLSNSDNTELSEQKKNSLLLETGTFDDNQKLKQLCLYRAFESSSGTVIWHVHIVIMVICIRTGRYN